MTGPAVEPDPIVAENTRRIVGLSVLRKLHVWAVARTESEESDRRLVRWIVCWLGLVVFLLAIIPFMFEGHPKVRLFAMSVGAGILLAGGMIAWSHWRSQRRKSNLTVETETRDERSRLSP